MSRERRRAVESLLNRLAGVQSARVETTREGEVEQIHVVSTGRFSPEQQARNIESALLATLNIEVDPRLISVVSLKEAEEGKRIVEQPEEPAEAREIPEAREVSEARERRVRLLHISYEQDRFKVTARAELALGEQTLAGESEDTDTAKGRMVAAARATLNALENLTDRRVAFFLEGLEAYSTFEREIVVASLRLVSEFRKSNLVGCATVEEDPNYAAAQAVLGAVNRSFAKLLVYATSSAEAGTEDASPSSSSTGEAQERYAELS